MTQTTYKDVIIRLIRGDIATQKADAIVNAANAHLAGGGGVDGAIHRKGGPSIMEETNRLYPTGCPTGSAVLSSAGNLDAKFIIHAVAPRYSPHKTDNARLLYGAYYASLTLAAENDCQSVALPSLGTGAYSYPLHEASQIALQAVRDFLDQPKRTSLIEINFILFDLATLNCFQTSFQSIFPFPGS